VPRVHRGRIPEDGFVLVVATNPRERELSAALQSSSLDHLVISGGEQIRRRKEAVRPPSGRLAVPSMEASRTAFGATAIATLLHALDEVEAVIMRFANKLAGLIFFGPSPGGTSQPRSARSHFPAVAAWPQEVRVRSTI
jgi:hypothetical protein